MLKIAITGNIASGKSSVEKILKEKGFKVLDSDIVAHDLLKNEKIKKQIILEFEKFEILENNEISRKKLGKVVFEDESLRKKIESILHPVIREEIERFFRQQTEQGEKIAFVSVPLLFEAKIEKLFDKIILIYANDKIRTERLIKRNNLSLEQAQNRLGIQISQNEKISLSDYVIYNNETLNELNKKIDDLITSL